MKRAISDTAKQARRQAIITAALEAFYQQGFTATRMEDIAKAAGVSKGTLYLYFQSKEAVFVALVEQIARPRIQAIEAFIDKAEDTFTGIDILCRQIPILIRQSPIPKLLKVLISDAKAFPDVVENYRTNIVDHALSALTRLLEKGVARGEIKVESPALTARLIVAPMILSVIWTMVFETEKPDTHLDINALMQQHKTLLHRALHLSTEHSS